MNEIKIRELVALYKKILEERGIEKKFYSDLQTITEPSLALGHCYAMLDKIEFFIKQGRMRKVFTWLGFIQACLWLNGVYVIEDFRDHNSPDRMTPDDAKD